MKTITYPIVVAICLASFACKKNEITEVVPIGIEKSVIKPCFNAKLISQDKASEDYLLFLKFYNEEPLTPSFGKTYLDNKVVYKIDGSATYDSSKNINVRCLGWQFLEIDYNHSDDAVYLVPKKQNGNWIYLIEPNQSFRIKVKLTAFAKSDSASIIKWIPENLTVEF
jgi:hypothetical protein